VKKSMDLDMAMTQHTANERVNQAVMELDTGRVHHHLIMNMAMESMAMVIHMELLDMDRCIQAMGTHILRE
jgi:hypothetical protein